MATILHLVIPGLLGPWPAEPGFPRPEAPALERLLARAELTTLAVSGLDATLFTLFGLPVAPDGICRWRPVTRLADSGDAREGWWLRADLVHLHADLQQVLLYDARTLAVDTDEAELLVAGFNRSFESSGPGAGCAPSQPLVFAPGYRPGLITCPLEQATGRNINALLPKGRDSGRWHAWLTEIQMIFHNSPVNLAREDQGLRTLNSVWFWGSGRLPHGASISATPSTPPILWLMVWRGWRVWRSAHCRIAPLTGGPLPRKKRRRWWCWKPPATIAPMITPMVGWGMSMRWSSTGLRLACGCSGKKR